MICNECNQLEAVIDNLCNECEHNLQHDISIEDWHKELRESYYRQIA